MKQKVNHLVISALLYWLIATYAGLVLVMPDKIINVAVFLPPILCLLWGPTAAVGVYIGGICTFPAFNEISSAGLNFNEFLQYAFKSLWIFAAGYLPYVLWRKLKTDSGEIAPSLSVGTLRKFLEIFFITFIVTSGFKAITATDIELEAVTDWFFEERKATLSIYMFACFVNDFFVAIFLDLAWFFFLISRDYNFYKFEPATLRDEGNRKNIKSWNIAFGFYALFPFGVLYLDRFQIYGMDSVNTWLFFVSKALSMIDLYLIMMLYFMLHYRHSIMIEIIFLVSQTVFFSASVLGWGSSLAMGNMVNSHANDSLHAMSAICRERLYRTFFLVRQAVNTMKLQATDSIESYERLANDSEYRKNYLAAMKNTFNFEALEIDGSISFYLRFIPEIEGTQGGFSMQREEARWEGGTSPFVEREPIDLAPYAPDDIPKVGWYYIPKKAKCATWIEPYVDAVTNFYVISYVAPLFLDGKFIGVVGMDIDFNFIIQELRRMSIYDYGYVYIMNRNNIVLYHKDQPQGSVFQPNPEFQEIEMYLSNGMWLGIATPLSRIHEVRNNMMIQLIAAIIFVAMIISIISIAFASLSISPLEGMTAAARRIAAGDLNVKIFYDSENELGVLVRSIREMAAQLEVYVYRDKLTGLLNAAAYISKKAELDGKIKARSDVQYAVVIFDANFLKKVNDNYGHEAGNEMLRHAAKVIDEVFANSSVYRIGGDEFAAVLETQDYENREKLLTVFDERVEAETYKAGEDTLTVSIARGLGVYKNGMDFAEVAQQADDAMYIHKTAIKSKYGEEVR